MSCRVLIFWIGFLSARCFTGWSKHNHFNVQCSCGPATVLTISDHDRLNCVSSWHLEFVISIKFVIAFQIDWICMYYHKAPKLNMGKNKQIIVPMSMRLGRARPMLTWPYSALQWESVTAAAGQHDPSLATVNSQSMLSRSDTRTRVHQSVFSYPLTQPSLNKVLSSEDAATWW